MDILFAARETTSFEGKAVLSNQQKGNERTVPACEAERRYVASYSSSIRVALSDRIFSEKTVNLKTLLI